MSTEVDDVVRKPARTAEMSTTIVSRNHINEEIGVNAFNKLESPPCGKPQDQVLPAV